MGNNEFQEKSIYLVKQFYKGLDTADEEIDVYVVWISKVLQNNKCLISTNIPDGRYFEITYNGDNEEFYFDSYQKEINIRVANSDSLNVSFNL